MPAASKRWDGDGGWLSADTEDRTKTGVRATGASRMRRQKINSFICRKFNVTMLSILAQRQFSLPSWPKEGGLKGVERRFEGGWAF